MKNGIIDQKASVYESDGRFSKDNQVILSAYSNRIIDILGGEDQTRKLSLLELGLGHGHTTKVFYEKFASHTVIDGDAEVIDYYKANNSTKNVKLVHSYFEDYDSDKCYDVIIAGFVLEHVNEPVEILIKYKKMLVEGGKLFVAVPNALCMNRRLGHEMGLLDDMYVLSETDRMLGHRRYYDVDSIKKCCMEAGLHVINVEGIYIKPFTSAQMQLLNLPEEVYKALCTIAKDYPELSLGILLECCN